MSRVNESCLICMMNVAFERVMSQWNESCNGLMCENFGSILSTVSSWNVATCQTDAESCVKHASRNAVCLTSLDICILAEICLLSVRGTLQHDKQTLEAECNTLLETLQDERLAVEAEGRKMLKCLHDKV